MQAISFPPEYPWLKSQRIGKITTQEARTNQVNKESVFFIEKSIELFIALNLLPAFPYKSYKSFMFSVERINGTEKASAIHTLFQR